MQENKPEKKAYCWKLESVDLWKAFINICG